MSPGRIKKQVAVSGLTGLMIGLFLFSGCVSALKTSDTEEQVTPLTQEERYVKSIEVFQKPETTRIHIVSNKKLSFTSVKQSFPLGIAVYLPGAQMGSDLLKLQRFNAGVVTSVAAGFADQESTTLKIEVLLNKNADYEVIEDDGLWLTVTEAPASAPTRPVVMKASQPASAGSGLQASPAVSGKPSAPAGTAQSEGNAVLTGIEFDVSTAGESEIAIVTSQVIDYNVTRGNDGKLILELRRTTIPDFRQRPLITTYFKSAVERIDPVQASEENSRIVVSLREMVPYRVVQQENTLSLFIEPSTVEPPGLPMPVVKLASGSVKKNSDEAVIQARTAQQEPASSSSAPVMNPSMETKAVKEELSSDASAGTPQAEDHFTLEKERYTGEKIRLDFFETDIKNVFRILRSVSGGNFAVDRDVSGDVTLTLDKPVPWDQVLDLVLKMNGLGKEQEGNIIRIATLETLREEEELRQKAIAAKQRALEQEKELEPLLTTYIPINYAKAAEDIAPHLKDIVSKDRGMVSVNERTNMIILTDTKAKIDAAMALIYKLDKVTPQIMISAKVVEVSENFSRALGIDWSMSSEDVYRDDLGGEYGFDIAMNYPVTSSSSIGYTFDRITGTPFALSAQLTAGESKGNVKIISSPRILTLDHKTATIKQGLEYAYLERDDSGGSSVKFKDIDLLLEVTPHVTPDDRISMKVYITKNDIDSINEDGVPSLSTNEANTELLVNDGNTIVIGGIVKNSLTESKSGFPYLADIPILGYLFSSNSTAEKTNELLIFITPTIVQLEQREN